MVYCAGLENRRAERLRGFESHPLRHDPQPPANPYEYRGRVFGIPLKRPFWGAGVPESGPFRREKPHFVRRQSQGDQYSATAL